MHIQKKEQHHHHHHHHQRQQHRKRKESMSKLTIEIGWPTCASFAFVFVYYKIVKRFDFTLAKSFRIQLDLSGQSDDTSFSPIAVCLGTYTCDLRPFFDFTIKHPICLFDTHNSPYTTLNLYVYRRILPFYILSLFVKKRNVHSSIEN